MLQAEQLLTVLCKADVAFVVIGGDGGCRARLLICHRTRDFVSVERFALRVIEPGAFLQHIGALP